MAMPVVASRKNHQAHHVLSYIFQLLLKHLSEHIPSIHPNTTYIHTYAMNGSHRTFHHEQFHMFYMHAERFFSLARSCMNTEQQQHHHHRHHQQHTHLWETFANKKGNTVTENCLHSSIWFERLIDQIKHIDLFSSIVPASLCCCTHKSVVNFARDYTKEKWFLCKMSSSKRKITKIDIHHDVW